MYTDSLGSGTNFQILLGPISVTYTEPLRVSTVRSCGRVKPYWDKKESMELKHLRD